MNKITLKIYVSVETKDRLRTLARKWNVKTNEAAELAIHCAWAGQYEDFREKLDNFVVFQADILEKLDQLIEFNLTT